MHHPRFKKLAGGYPSFIFPQNLLEEVDLQDFYKAEKDRLPLFVGTQFGMHPGVVSLEHFEGQQIAVLGKSALSGSQSAIVIYRISKGNRVEVKKISLEEPFWQQRDLRRYEDFEQRLDDRVKDQIREFHLYDIWHYLEDMGIRYKGRSLSEIYHLVTARAYSDFVIVCAREKDLDWTGFLSGGEAETYLELYRLLDESRKSLHLRRDDLPLAVEMQLRMFRNIRNPYRKRSKRSSELPVEEDILVLSDLGLCIYYNNYININSLEANKIQQEILLEFKQRDYYIKNEGFLMNNANPVELKAVVGISVMGMNSKVTYRNEKDIAPMENGPSNPQLIYEHFYGVYSRLTDVQLVDHLNNQVGLRYWGMGRAAVVRGMRSQLKKRDLDTSSINSETSFSLKYCVVLDNKKLLRLGDLSEKRITPILHNYLRQCYPHLETKEIRIISYNLDKIQVLDSCRNRLYELPINDLIKKKGEMRCILAPEK